MTPPSDTRQALLEDIKELTADRKQIPTMSEFVSETDWKYKHVEQTFSTWETAVEAAGIDFEASLITELETVAEEVNHPPTPAEVDTHGHHPSGMYRSVFGSWEEAIAKAEIPQEEPANDINTSESDQQVRTSQTTETPATATDTDNGILDSIVSEFETEDSQ